MWFLLPMLYTIDQLPLRVERPATVEEAKILRTYCKNKARGYTAARSRNGVLECKVDGNWYYWPNETKGK